MVASASSIQVFASTLKRFLPEFTALHDRLEAHNFDKLHLSADSARLPEMLRLNAVGPKCNFYFTCDSNEVCRVFCDDGSPKYPHAVYFSVVGFLNEGAIGPLCREIDGVAVIARTMATMDQRTADKAAASIKATLEQFLTLLDSSDRPAAEVFDQSRIDAMVAKFMRDHDHIFGHQKVEARQIHRVGEVTDWLATHPEFVNAEDDVRLLCYCVYVATRQICLEGMQAEYSLRYR